jgi:hypothetical protein
METYQKKITSLDDVIEFFKHLIYDIGVNFHPDDSFHDYINNETKEPTMDSEEADKYDALMEDCFKVCDNNEKDIYTLAIEVFGEYYRSIGNDMMAKLCDSYNN